MPSHRLGYRSEGKQEALSRDQRKEANLANRAAAVTRQAGLAFLQADSDNDGLLSFEEFKSCFARLHRTSRGIDSDEIAESTLQKIFSEMDHDRSGTIEMDEYFIWALGIAGLHGGGLGAVFRKYDQDAKGTLDLIEFALAVGDLGFDTSFASEIFMDLDEDNSGTIEYGEILTSLRDRLSSISNGTKHFLASLAFQNVPRSDGASQVDVDLLTNVDTSTWRLVGPDEESLRAQIVKELLRNSLRSEDLYDLMMVQQGGGSDESALMTQLVFVDALKKLGYTGPTVILSTVFNVLDADGSGVIGRSEMHNWMTGLIARKVKAREAHLLCGQSDGRSLADVEWTATGLRSEMVAMLRRLDLTPLDLVRSWDRSKSGMPSGFTQRQFITMMKRVVRPTNEVTDPLWYYTIRPLIEQMFRKLSGKDDIVNVIEFAKWVNEEWRRQMFEAKQNGTSIRAKPSGRKSVLGAVAPGELVMHDEILLPTVDVSTMAQTGAPSAEKRASLISIHGLFFHGLSDPTGPSGQRQITLASPFVSSTLPREAGYSKEAAGFHRRDPTPRAPYVPDPIRELHDYLDNQARPPSPRAMRIRACVATLEHDVNSIAIVQRARGRGIYEDNQMGTHR